MIEPQENLDNVPLASVFQVDPALFTSIPIEVLHLSQRPWSGLMRGNIQYIDELLKVTREDLLRIRSMGRTSVAQIEENLGSYLKRRLHPNEDEMQVLDPSQQDEPTPLFPSLRDELITLSCWRHDSINVPMHLSRLPEHVTSKLAEAQLQTWDAVLDCTWNDIERLASNPDGKLVLDALVKVTSQATWERLPVTPEFWPGPDGIAYFIESGYSQTSLFDIQISPSTRALLTPKGTISDLLSALDDPTSGLMWDLPAYVGAWQEANGLGLRFGGALEYRLLCTEANRPSLLRALELASATCYPSQWRALCERFGLRPGERRHTLQEMASRWQLTRERVRQIEQSAFKKLRRDPTTISLAHSLRYLVDQAGGVLSLAEAGEQLGNHFEAGNHSASNFCHLLFEVFAVAEKAPRSDLRELHGALSVQAGSIYVLKGQKADFSLVMTVATKLWAQRASAIEKNLWVDMVQQGCSQSGEDVDRKFIKACLRADGRFDPAGFESVDVRRTLDEALVETLQRYGAPAHFTVITEKLNEWGLWGKDSTERNVHGRMGMHPDLFVCVARGTYGLVAWGLEEQRVTRDTTVPIADLIEEFLESCSEPRPVAEIIDYVLARKRSHDYSVSQRLHNDPKFHRFARGVYGLKKWNF